MVDAVVSSIAYDATLLNNVTTYLVDVTPVEAPEYMRSGMTANVYFTIQKNDNVLIIPSVAIEKIENEHFVLKSANNERKRAPIEIGITDGKMTEVISGLDLNESILVKELDFGENEKSSNPFMPSRKRKGR
jgi:macrolide-specific efflux system membrane fusion protein